MLARRTPATFFYFSIGWFSFSPEQKKKPERSGSSLYDRFLNFISVSIRLRFGPGIFLSCFFVCLLSPPPPHWLPVLHGGDTVIFSYTWKKSQRSFFKSMQEFFFSQKKQLFYVFLFRFFKAWEFSLPHRFSFYFLSPRPLQWETCWTQVSNAF